MGFARKIESFVCEQCGGTTEGNGYTNHCPSCLWSKHVDNDPGDRAAGCGGMMRPIGAQFERDGFVLTHHCVVCGKQITNKAAPGDDQDLLISLTSQPL